MRITFRQGLISFQKDTGNPVFLQPSGTPGFVSHMVSPTPTTITFAHGTSDYLATFDATVVNAWGPMIPGVDNYLYWDIDLLTSQVSRGLTTLIPVNSLTPPASPANDQHWFDLNVMKMKVWSSASNKWRERVRVFAGFVENGNTSQITMFSEGSQVGLNSTPSNPGYIVLDTLLQPIRKSVGEFLTDDDMSRVRTTSGTSGVLVQPVNRIVPVRAGEAIPRMSLVYFSGPDIVRLASSNPALVPARIPVGVVVDELANGDVGTIVTSGELTHDQWDWSGNEGKPLYCDSFGTFTLTRPAGLFTYRVGFVKNAQTVLFGVDAETFPQVYTADVNSLQIAGTTPVEITDVINLLGERIVTISAPNASPSTAGWMSAAVYSEHVAYDARLDSAEASIISLQTSKSDVGHTHPIAEVVGLQTELDDINTELDTKADKVIGAVSGHFAGLDVTGNLTDSGFSSANFSLVGHVHTIPDVTGLQDALNLKSDITHTHTIANVTGLQAALDGKAALVHGHAIADVTGLQVALDGKSDVGHGHAIADVTNLQTELDNRAFVSHTHTISNVTGLQTALDGKSDVAHTHVPANVTGGIAGQVLVSDGTGGTWDDLMEPNNIYFWVSDTNGDDTTGIGSMNRPFKTIQAAIDAHVSAGGCIINVMAGSFFENITVNKNAVTLIGVGTTDSQMIEILGHVTVDPAITRFRARDIQFDGQVNGTPTVTFNGTAGRHYFDNCSFIHAGGAAETVLSWTGTCERWHDFTTCWIGGVANFGGTPASSAQARFTLCDGDTSNYQLAAANWTVRIQNTYRVGQVNHTAGELIMNDVMEFTTASADGIVSTATTGGKNRMLLNGVNMRRPDGTMKLINKTGDAPYLFSNCIRSVVADTITGTPVAIGPDTVDQRVGIATNASDTFALTYNQHTVVATSTNARSITLPAGIVGKQYVIKDGAGNASGAAITITPNGAETIDGAATYTIDTDYGVLHIVWNGSTWVVMSSAAGSGASSLNDLIDVAISMIGLDPGDIIYYDGSEWINGAKDVVAPTYFEAVATAGQTTFNTGSVPTKAKGTNFDTGLPTSYLQVYVNGVFQQEGATKAYTVTGNNQITFTSGLALNDDVVLYSYSKQAVGI